MWSAFGPKQPWPHRVLSSDGSARRSQYDLDEDVGIGQAAFGRRPGRRIRGIDPVLPDTVHRIEVLDIPQPDRRCQKTRSGGADRRQPGIDLGQNLACLALDIRGQIVGGQSC